MSSLCIKDIKLCASFLLHVARFLLGVLGVRVPEVSPLTDRQRVSSPGTVPTRLTGRYVLSLLVTAVSGHPKPARPGTAYAPGERSRICADDALGAGARGGCARPGPRAADRGQPAHLSVSEPLCTGENIKDPEELFLMWVLPMFTVLPVKMEDVFR